MTDEPAAPHHQHPLADQLRVLAGHVEEILDAVSVLEQRSNKLESELLDLAGRHGEIATAIKDLLTRRLRRDDERDEDRAIVRTLVWFALAIAGLTVVAHLLLASRWATGPLTLDPRGLFPELHSSQTKGRTP